MCGICGFVDLSAGMSADAATRAVRRATRVLHHRGPDDGDVFVDAAAGVALGHRRLAIIDLTPDGRQPMTTADGRHRIVFNGEIYNFEELRAELRARGCRFRGRSDTEVLLAACVEWGVHRTLERARGMFAFALWDASRRTLTLARDRLGEKPLYYGLVGTRLVFASELKAIVALEPTLDVDRSALAAMLRFGYVPAPHSIYRGIHKLPPGTFLEVPHGARAGLPEPVPYWSLRGLAERAAAARTSMSDEEAIVRLEAVLRDALRGQMISDVPLGAFLSGGIDSSAIVALMQKESARPVKTFTIGFADPRYDEASHARAVAGHLGTDHTELYVTPRDALDVVPLLPTIYDEPFADSSQIPTFLVSKLARSRVTVSLSGDGGDELFGGYTRYDLARTVGRAFDATPRAVREAVSALLRSTPSRGIARTLQRALFGHGRARFDLGARVDKLADVLGAHDDATLYRDLLSHFRDPGAWALGADEAPSPFDRGAPRGLPFVERMMYLDAVTYLPDDILVKVDRAAMAVSLETRVPLLDPRVVELAFELPLHQKIRGRESKWILRRMLHRHVPAELVERPKMGFAMPIDAWLRDELRAWAEDLLDEGTLRRQGHLDARRVRALWAEHLRGVPGLHYRLWNILMFQGWVSAPKVDLDDRASDAHASE